jgi:hypothetical protein
MKLCKDCKHFKKFLHFSLCDHPSVEHSVINGAAILECPRARAPAYGECGPDAKLFEQREPVPVGRPGEVAQVLAQVLEDSELWNAMIDRRPWWRRIFGG